MVTVRAAGLMVTASALFAVAPLLSLTWTVKPAFDTAAVGVPLIVPADLSKDRPVGRVPVEDQLQPNRQPLAVSACEYARSTVQLGSVAGLIVMAA